MIWWKKRLQSPSSLFSLALWLSSLLLLSWLSPFWPFCFSDSYPASISARFFYSALLRVPFYQDCRLPWSFLKITSYLDTFPKLLAALDLAFVRYASAWTTISLLNTSLWPNQAYLVIYKIILLYLPFAIGVPHAKTVSSIKNYLFGSNKPLARCLQTILANFLAVTG